MPTNPEPKSDDETEKSRQTRNVGVGTSPDGRIAIAIDGRGHIIDPEDAQWIAQEIWDLCGDDKYSGASFEWILDTTKGVGTRARRSLNEAGIETADDLREASFAELEQCDGIGGVVAARLKDAAHDQWENMNNTNQDQ